MKLRYISKCHKTPGDDLYEQVLAIPIGIELWSTEIIDRISYLFFFTEYHNLKAKLSNNRPRYQPAAGISDTTQRRPVNQANNITHATVDHIYSTSSIAEGVFWHLSFYSLLQLDTDH